MKQRLIITAASEAFGPALLGMLGSMNVNWPDHPPVLVYDLGLPPDILKILDDAKIQVRQIPPFCPHWRKHYTWKLWCWNDAPADHVFWIDAGMAFLQPLEEVFQAVESIGYFVICNHCSLENEASDMACKGCGVPPDFRRGKPTFPANVFGYDKSGKPGEVVHEAYQVGLLEEHIKAYEPPHRYEQAIASLLWHKYFSPIAIHDRLIYASLESPTNVPGQKLWNCHRSMHPDDLQYFIDHIRQPGAPRLPRLEPRPKKALHHRAMGFALARYRQMISAMRPPPVIKKPYDGIAEAAVKL